MKRLQKLINVSNYVETFSVPGYPNINPIRVVDGDNASGYLSKAGGQQLLIALPEGRSFGQNTDTFSESIGVAFFALAKINGPSRTQELADRTYRELLDLGQAVLDRITEDLIGKPGATCPLLAGLNITEASMVPIYSSFGGWSGWAIELTLE